jgi:DNA-binding transcriptional ArsR family regulator
MNVEDKFVSISALLCEPTRAKMLWNLLDGRAYTAGELSIAADTSPTSASNHLSKLLEAEVIKVETQGRHRYYSLSNPEVAYVIEGLANLSNNKAPKEKTKEQGKNGVKYCRSCYDHLAGYVGVEIVEALETKEYLSKSNNIYLVTEKGWEWFRFFNIGKEDFSNSRRPLTRQCLDWSERRPHLAGQLGAVFFNKMVERKWFKKVKFSRELIVTNKAVQELYDLLNVTIR